MSINYEEYAKVFKAISDAKRLEILALLAGGELCACRILERFHVTQPTLSHDMKLLCEAGLVVSRKEGKWSYYSLNQERLSEIQVVLAGIADYDKSSEESFSNKLC